MRSKQFSATLTTKMSQIPSTNVLQSTENYINDPAYPNCNIGTKEETMMEGMLTICEENSLTY